MEIDQKYRAQSMNLVLGKISLLPSSVSSNYMYMYIRIVCSWFPVTMIYSIFL